MKTFDRADRIGGLVERLGVRRRGHIDGWDVFVVAASVIVVVWYLFDAARVGLFGWAVLPSAAIAVSVLLRHARPRIATAVVVAAAVGASFIDTSSIAVWTATQLILLSASLAVGRTASIPLAAGVGGALFLCSIAVYQQPVLSGAPLGVLSWTLGVWGLAAAISSGRSDAQQWEEQARRLHDTREEEIRRHLVEERLRIARDLHDELGHQIAVIGINAGAAEAALATHPEEARAPLRTVRDASRAALRELQVILGVLRSDDDPVSFTAINDLITAARNGGMSVDADRLDTSVLPADRQAAAYRAVQEGLTNARKHGTGPVTVRARTDDRRWTLTISNPTSPGSTGGGGLGLIGMRERVEQAGGVLRVAHVPRSFTLTIEFPLPEAPA